MTRSTSSRRTWLSTAPLAAAGLVLSPRPGAAQEGRGANLSVDVALLGHTNAPNLGGALNLAGGDFRGISFIVEGLIFPAGTIAPGVVFDPATATPMGHWLCRGWSMSHPARRFPDTAVSQEFLFGLLQPDAPSPADTLSTSGVEPGFSPHHTVMSIVGGTGRYRHVRGEVVARNIGTNTTILNAVGIPAPNFRFDFRF